MNQPLNMQPRPLGQTGLSVTPIGFGAFKIGRNVGIKYPRKYELPDDQAVGALLHGVLDLGINYLDTAPAYGSSEQRIGLALAHRRGEFVLSTKVGERFDAGRSSFDFTAPGIEQSVTQSLARLRTDVLDVVFLHSDGRDVEIMERTEAVVTLQRLRQRGLVRAIGLSGKTVAGARAALAWADVLMVEYNLEDRSHQSVIAEAAAAGVGVVVKKGLGSGRLPAEQSVRHVCGLPGVSSMVIGSLSLEHLRQDIAAACI